MHCTPKIVVFDLDETLGYYTEFGMFWDALNSYIRFYEESIKQGPKDIPLSVSDQKLFNKVLDLYPEFHRPNILNILHFLKEKKTSSICHKLMIYTNNQGPPEWVHQIKTYFETKLDYPLFDHVIKAFKIKGKQIELYRTSHMKCHKDLINCTQIPEDTEICFLDDKFHQGMIHDKVYYINIKPYYHDLSFDEMIERFVKSGLLETKDTDIKSYLLSFLKRFNYTFTKKTKEAQNLDKILSKKIMHHLHIFFEEKDKEKDKEKGEKSKTQKIYKTNKPKKGDRKKSVKKR
jgi:hypothetical protein